MIEIKLSKGYVAIVDDCDADLAGLKWSARVVPNLVYAFRTIKRNRVSKSYTLHRMIMEKILGRSLLSSEFVDHLDNNPLNNTRSNLRLATPSENTKNSRLRKTSKSGFKGVTWHKRSRKWQAVICNQGKDYYLGLFITPEEAHEAYKRAACELHGEFANFGRAS